RVRVEGELDAVAVVGVDVHVAYLPAAAAQLRDGQHRVVDIAEARGALGHGVVQPAREVEGARGLVVEDELRGQQRTAGHQLGRLPEARGDRGVGGPAPLARRGGD